MELAARLEAEAVAAAALDSAVASGNAAALRKALNEVFNQIAFIATPCPPSTFYLVNFFFPLIVRRSSFFFCPFLFSLLFQSHLNLRLETFNRFQTDNTNKNIPCRLPRSG